MSNERMTDAAMADSLMSLASTFHQQHDSELIDLLEQAAAALRARPQAVGEGAVVMPKEVPNAIRNLIEDAVAYETDNEISQSGITDLWFDIRNQLAMLAASQSATGGA